MSSNIHPHCPILHGSEMFDKPYKCQKVTEIRVLDSSHSDTDDICALSMDTLAHDNEEINATSISTPYFWCNFCPYTTENKTSLVEHVSMHRFGCQNCPFHSYSRARVVQHVLLEHSRVVSNLGDLNYCRLVQAKEHITEKNTWHKPCYQEMKYESDDDHHDLSVSGKNKFSNLQNEEFSNIYTRFKKYFANRAADAKTRSKNDYSKEDTITTDNRDKQLPLYIATNKEEFKAAAPSSCTLKNGIKISHTERTFPTIKHLLTSNPDSVNRPNCGFWQTYGSEEDNISIPESNVMKENGESENGTVDKQKFMQCSSKSSHDMQCSSECSHDADVQCPFGVSKDIEYSSHLNTDLKKKQKCRKLSSVMTMSDPGTLEAPDEDSEYSRYDKTRRTSLEDGIIKYIYDDNYNASSNEYFSHSGLYRQSQLKYSLELQSDIAQTGVCKTSEGKQDSDGVLKYMLTQNLSTDFPFVLDRAIKTEPVDAGEATTVQYRVNENIQIKKENCQSCEEPLASMTHNEVRRPQASKTCDEYERVCTNEGAEMNHFQELQDGGNGVAVNQGCTTSTQSTTSRIVWDCGQCEFQSNNYEQYKSHVCSLHVAYSDEPNHHEDLNVKPVEIKLPKKRDVLKRKAVTRYHGILVSQSQCNSEMYSCRTCNYANSSSDAVKSHNQKQHLPTLLAMNSNNMVVFYCPHNCAYMSDDNVDYLSHIKQCGGSLLETETETSNTHSNLFQTSLMLTLRHILSSDKAKFKRVFICVICNFETNVLADMTSHTSVHSNSKHVAIRLDPYNRKVTWFCLHCQISINLMQLKKHECDKVGTPDTSDTECSQCCSGKRSSMYVCVKCKYQTGCLLTIIKHRNDVCKGLYKEIKLSSNKPEEMLYSFQDDVGEISKHTCLAENKSTVSSGALAENSDKRQTRSFSKIVNNNVSSCFDQTERRKSRCYVDDERLTAKFRNDLTKATTKPELQSIQPKKRKRTGLREQTYCKFLKIPIVDCVKIKEQEIRNCETQGVAIETENTQRNSVANKSKVYVTTDPIEGENKEMNESEFQPLSMLEWLNTESQRMLKLLKP